MPKKTDPLIGLYMLIVIVLILLLYLVFRSFGEGFEEAATVKKEVPPLCAKYGYPLSKGLHKLYTDFTNNTDPKKDSMLDTFINRQYTPADCNNLSGIYTPGLFGVGGNCFQLNDTTKSQYGFYNTDPSNITRNFNEYCSGLNAETPTLPPECKTGKDDTPGTLLKSFTITYLGKPYTISDGTLRLYTQAECDKLEGVFTNVGTIEKAMEKSLDQLVADWKDQKGNPILSMAEITKALSINDAAKGICFSKNQNNFINYSIACAAPSESSMFGGYF
jgi:hypothetical protein